MFYGTDQKRTDLSELPDTSSRREGTTSSVLTKSECARVDEIIALVLKRLIRDRNTSRKIDKDPHICIPDLDGLC